MSTVNIVSSSLEMPVARPRRVPLRKPASKPASKPAGKPVPVEALDVAPVEAPAEAAPTSDTSDKDVLAQAMALLAQLGSKSPAVARAMASVSSASAALDIEDAAHKCASSLTDALLLAAVPEPPGSTVYSLAYTQANGWVVSGAAAGTTRAASGTPQAAAQPPAGYATWTAAAKALLPAGHPLHARIAGHGVSAATIRRAIEKLA